MPNFSIISKFLVQLDINPKKCWHLESQILFQKYKVLDLVAFFNQQQNLKHEKQFMFSPLWANTCRDEFPAFSADLKTLLQPLFDFPCLYQIA